MITEIFNLQPKKLENELIAIVPLDEKDFDSLFAVASDPLIWELHPETNRYKKEIFKIYFDEAVASNSAFLIYDKATNELMGSTRFYNFQPELSKIAIGYTFLARKYWGGKYNAAMKKLLLDYAFKFVDTVVFHIGASNIRSQKAILKIGAKKINEINLDNHGTKIPHYEYEIKKSEWR
jgi:RimJ/RimL family protein N-acetyltransferase